MKLLIDVNVLLDVVLQREPWAESAASLLEKADFNQALILPTDDFEDAVQAAAALKVGLDYIVTRDEGGFGGLSVPPLNSGEVLALL